MIRRTQNQLWWSHEAEEKIKKKLNIWISSNVIHEHQFLFQMILWQYLPIKCFILRLPKWGKKSWAIRWCHEVAVCFTADWVEFNLLIEFKLEWIGVRWFDEQFSFLWDLDPPSLTVRLHLVGYHDVWAVHIISDDLCAKDSPYETTLQLNTSILPYELLSSCPNLQNRSSTWLVEWFQSSRNPSLLYF